MPPGTVKWFSNVKGYGFVNTDEDEELDIFAHFSAIEMDGYKKLTSGQKIEFDIDELPNMSIEKQQTYQIKIIDKDSSEVIYRGKMIATSQETQDFKLTNGLYTYE